MDNYIERLEKEAYHEQFLDLDESVDFQPRFSLCIIGLRTRLILIIIFFLCHLLFKY